MQVDVSVIIPARDRLWSLPRAVESCRSSAINVEIIVVDDGSADGTGDWLRRQPDVLVVAGDGWGKPWGVNQALPLARGTYLRYLDSDDWLNPGANELQFEIAEREHADLVVAGLDLYHGEGFLQRLEWAPTDDFVAQQLGEGFGSHYSAFLLRREFASGIPHRTLFPASNFASRDDRCFVLELALRNPRIAVCPAPTLCHRSHGEPRLQFASGLRGSGTDLQELYVLRQILRLLEQRGELTPRRRQAAVCVLWPLAHRIAYADLAMANEIVDWVHRLDPHFRAPEAGALGCLYRKLGFAHTERLLRLRRAVLGAVRGIGGRRSGAALAGRAS